jgi:hypothetical protein
MRLLRGGEVDRLMGGQVDVAAVFCEIQGCIGFGVFSVTIGQLTDEMSFVSTLRPCFSQRLSGYCLQVRIDLRAVLENGR